MDINLQLSVLYVKMYNDAKKNGKTYIPRGTVAKMVMKSIYDRFVNEKSIIPIEDLPEEEKLKLVDECRETSETFTNETLIETSKTVHLIKQINLYS